MRHLVIENVEKSKDGKKLVFMYSSGEDEEHEIQEDEKGRYVGGDPLVKRYLVENKEKLEKRRKSGDFQWCIFLIHADFRKMCAATEVDFRGAIFTQECFFGIRALQKELVFGGQVSLKELVFLSPFLVKELIFSMPLSLKTLVLSGQFLAEKLGFRMLSSVKKLIFLTQNSQLIFLICAFLLARK